MRWFFSLDLAALRHSTDVAHRVTGGSFPLGCCAGVSCGPPLHVANGVVRGAVFQFGDVAVYSCFGGYAMEGVGRSRCLENGTWTPPPTCRGRGNTEGNSPLSQDTSFRFTPDAVQPVFLITSWTTTTTATTIHLCISSSSFALRATSPENLSSSCCIVNFC